LQPIESLENVPNRLVLVLPRYWAIVGNAVRDLLQVGNEQGREGGVIDFVIPGYDAVDDAAAILARPPRYGARLSHG